MRSSGIVFGDFRGLVPENALVVTNAFNWLSRRQIADSLTQTQGDADLDKLMWKM
jgi:hypothetical protein